MTNSDKAKGRIKEAAGALSGDHDLKREGKADQASGRVKEAIDDTRDALEGVRDKIADAIHSDRK